MRTAQWTTTGIGLVDVDPPDLLEDHVRVAVSSCGICGSDLHLFRMMVSGALPPGALAAPGHEVAGRVVAGPPKLIDKLCAVEPLVGCQECPFCLQGEPSRCGHSSLLGIQRPGGLADFVDVPARLVHPVPDEVGEPLASLAEPWAVSVRGANRARLDQIGLRVLVLGAGTIGLLSGLAVRDRVRDVAITCRYPHQRAAAEQLGLTPVGPEDVDEWAASYGPDVVIESVGGEASTLSDAVRLARPGGRIVVLGVFDTPRLFDARTLVLKEIELVGSMMYGSGRRGSEFASAVDAMGRYNRELSVVQTHDFGLDDVVEAFRCASDKTTGSLKVTIRSGS